MRTLFTLILAIACASAFSQHPEKYFRFIEPNRNKINSEITNIISIDKISKDTVWAYANDSEFIKFEKLGYRIEILTPPSLQGAKVINMATAVSQMSSWDRYPTYEVYRAMMKKFESDFPSLCKLDSFGTTANGRKLYVLKISDNVLANEAEPELFCTSTMHGDETTGYILMLHLADSLLNGYNSSSRIKEIVDNRAIYINPNANPDGTYYYGNSTVSGATRYNGNNVDLNRNFPDPREGDHPDDNSWQPETQAMMSFAEQHNFVLAANFHGGEELANYPWDTWTSLSNPHADHSWYSTISRAYADTVHANSPSDYFTGENNGVTHGGDWYVVAGGRQDYMNYWHHCKEITLEISDTKLLSTNLLPAYWAYNKASLLNYIELTYTGFYGTITNASGNALPAKITVLSHDKDSSEVFTNPTFGNYYRMIAPGTYNITVSSTGYADVSVSNITINSDNNKIINIVMDGSIENQNLSGTILNSNNGNPIPNALVSVTSGSTTFQTTTNSSGVFAINSVPVGIIKVEVTAERFFKTTYHENLTLSQSNFTIKLVEQKLATVTFAIKSNTGPLSDAVVNFNQNQSVTNSSGVTSFENVPFGQSYPYTVTLSGYGDAQGNIDVNRDSTYTITLFPTTINNTVQAVELFNISPNPFSQRTSITCKLNQPSSIDIRIYDITGREILLVFKGNLPLGTYRWEWSHDENNQNKTTQNIYIVKIKCGGKTISKKIIHIN